MNKQASNQHRNAGGCSVVVNVNLHATLRTALWRFQFLKNNLKKCGKDVRKSHSTVSHHTSWRGVSGLLQRINARLPGSFAGVTIFSFSRLCLNWNWPCWTSCAGSWRRDLRKGYGGHPVFNSAVQNRATYIHIGSVKILIHTGYVT